MPTNTPSAAQLRRALELAEQIDKLEQELTGILSGTSLASAVSSTPAPAPAPVARGRRGGRRTVSPEARARMAAGQKARWAKTNSASRGSAKASGGPRKKRVLSPEGRARIVAALKARHAAKKQSAS